MDKPSVFFRTPQEHLNNMWKKGNGLPQSPLPGHVRVHLYVGWSEGCDETEFIMSHAAIKGDFPLEPSGHLSLSHVKSKWGLENCAAIDPTRCMKFDSSNPDYLSPLAIRVLTDKSGVLKLFEPKPSDETIAMREIRMHLIQKYDDAMFRFKEATIGRLSDVLGVAATAVLLMFILLLVSAALGYHFLHTQRWLVHAIVAGSW
ncbi:hypothetical protein PAXRUDRAFT_204762 [Paxillus rubicundulus Ve08.2h10]|uniref:Uncharacterized protein n=1 Tax=Paxillus rubicundulus Ve08.2h10 TaxID=930991 RepID=A0A0D0DHF2_9AGAM|nr:hypothetical protein PAXRUDRAFT_204762 [Paxillus rubicundulus Ve08.2h10]